MLGCFYGFLSYLASWRLGGENFFVFSLVGGGVFSDFIRIILVGRVQLEGLLPLGHGLILLPHLHEGLGQVVVNDRVVFLLGLEVREGLLQLGLGVLVLALLEINPAQAVQVIGIVGVQLDRGLDVFFGVVQLDAFVGVGITDIVVGIPVVGLHLDDL